MTFSELILSLDYTNTTAAMMAAADWLEERGYAGSVAVRRMALLIAKINNVCEQCYDKSLDIYNGDTTGRFVVGPIRIYHNAVVFPVRSYDTRHRIATAVTRTHHIFPANTTGATGEVFHPQVVNLLQAYNYSVSYRQFDLIQQISCDYPFWGQVAMPVLMLGNKFGFLEK